MILPFSTVSASPSTTSQTLRTKELDAEVESAAGVAKSELQRYRDLIADLGHQLDSSDPDGGELVGEWSAAKGG